MSILTKEERNMIRQSPMSASLKQQLLYEHSQELLVFFDQKGFIVDVNHAALEELGYNNEEIFSIPINEIFRKVINKEKDRLIINEKYRDKSVEAVIYRKNQTCFAAKLMISVRDVKKGFLGLCSAINISEEKETRRENKNIKNELISSRQYKTEFIANITHELRTPVNGILGMIKNLTESELTPKQLEAVNIIQRCCSNMDMVINDLLDFEKMNSNKLVLEQREFNFRKFIDNIISFNINKINEKGLELLVNIADDIPNFVLGDEFRLSQILNNLFSNAIKFTSVGQVALEVVKTAHNSDEIELFFMVMDTGIGISKEDMDKLFTSFTQVDGSITRRFGGTGLGLSICKMLVESMNGSITAESEKNKGSTFSFSVRLGISEDMDHTHGNNGSETDTYHYMVNRNQMSASGGELLHVSGTDYVGKILSEANFSLSKIHMGFQNELASPAGYKEVMQEMNDTMEKLIICIEMESWVKAEGLADTIKKLIPAEYIDISKKAFRLVLSVRRENHDTSLTIINELKAMMSEVKEWKI